MMKKPGSSSMLQKKLLNKKPVVSRTEGVVYVKVTGKLISLTDVTEINTSLKFHHPMD
jgi:hypothetical protein